MERAGERISVRWSQTRVEKLKELGWGEKSDGDIIDDALDEALENE